MNHGQRRSRSSRGTVTGASAGAVAPAGCVAAVASSAGIAIGAKAAVSWPPLCPASICARAASRAAARSSADCQRWAGSFARAAITTASSAGCTSGRHWEIGGGASERCFSATATALSPSKGSRPASIS